jgi:proline iminopeptidase
VKRLVLLLAACGGAPRGAPPPGPPADARLAPGDHLVMLDGEPLAYHVAGTGPVCLAMPGGPGIDAAYLRSAAERHLTMVYIDPAGTGASVRLADPSGYTRARYAADLEKLRAHLGIEKPCLLGHSYGGMAVLLHAVTHPDRVGRLILYDTTARADAEFSRAARARLAVHENEPWFTEVNRGFSEENRVKTDDDATRVLQQIAPAYFFQPRADLLAALRRSRGYAAPMSAVDRTPYDLRKELGKITVPTLVLVGRHDFVCAPEVAAEIAAGIPGAELHVFEKSGHFAHLEEPEAFARAIADFVR